MDPAAGTAFAPAVPDVRASLPPGSAVATLRAPPLAAAGRVFPEGVPAEVERCFGASLSSNAVSASLQPTKHSAELQQMQQTRQIPASSVSARPALRIEFMGIARNASGLRLCYATLCGWQLQHIRIGCARGSVIRRAPISSLARECLAGCVGQNATSARFVSGHAALCKLCAAAPDYGRLPGRRARALQQAATCL